MPRWLAVITLLMYEQEAQAARLRFDGGRGNQTIPETSQTYRERTNSTTCSTRASDTHGLEGCLQGSIEFTSQGVPIRLVVGLQSVFNWGSDTQSITSAGFAGVQWTIIPKALHFYVTLTYEFTASQTITPEFPYQLPLSEMASFVASAAISNRYRRMRFSRTADEETEYYLRLPVLQKITGGFNVQPDELDIFTRHASMSFSAAIPSFWKKVVQAKWDFLATSDFPLTSPLRKSKGSPSRHKSSEHYSMVSTGPVTDARKMLYSFLDELEVLWLRHFWNLPQAKAKDRWLKLLDDCTVVHAARLDAAYATVEKWKQKARDEDDNRDAHVLYPNDFKSAGKKTRRIEEDPHNVCDRVPTAKCRETAALCMTLHYDPLRLPIREGKKAGRYAAGFVNAFQEVVDAVNAFERVWLEEIETHGQLECRLQRRGWDVYEALYHEHFENAIGALARLPRSYLTLFNTLEPTVARCDVVSEESKDLCLEDQSELIADTLLDSGKSYAAEVENFSAQVDARHWGNGEWDVYVMQHELGRSSISVDGSAAELAFDACSVFRGVPIAEATKSRSMKVNGKLGSHWRGNRFGREASGCDKWAEDLTMWRRREGQLWNAVSTGDISKVNGLLATSVNLDARNPFAQGRTALHLAVLTGQKHITKMLLDAGASRAMEDWEGQTPAILAAENLLERGTWEVLKAFEEMHKIEVKLTTSDLKLPPIHMDALPQYPVSYPYNPLRILGMPDVLQTRLARFDQVVAIGGVQVSDLPGAAGNFTYAVHRDGPTRGLAQECEQRYCRPELVHSVSRAMKQAVLKDGEVTLVVRKSSAKPRPPQTPRSLRFHTFSTSRWPRVVMEAQEIVQNTDKMDAAKKALAFKLDYSTTFKLAAAIDTSPLDFCGWWTAVARAEFNLRREGAVVRKFDEDRLGYVVSFIDKPWILPITEQLTSPDGRFQFERSGPGAYTVRAWGFGEAAALIRSSGLTFDIAGAITLVKQAIGMSPPTESSDIMERVTGSIATAVEEGNTGFASLFRAVGRNSCSIGWPAFKSLLGRWLVEQKMEVNVETIAKELGSKLTPMPLKFTVDIQPVVVMAVKPVMLSNGCERTLSAGMRVPIRTKIEIPGTFTFDAVITYTRSFGLTWNC